MQEYKDNPLLDTSSKPEPVAVVISDIHYNINTLEVADAALKQAVDKANILGVRLIICGDLHDTKANLRAECMNRMYATLQECNTRPFILRGNHDSLNEKSSDHALNFLDSTCDIIKEPLFCSDWNFIPYQHDPAAFKEHYDKIPKGSTVFIHQGVLNSNSGHYFKDNSAIPKDWLQWNRVISGHYHTRQSIECGQLHGAYLGQLDYIGNPYTLGFGEANDPAKGFQVLYDDGSLRFVPTNLRHHRIIEIDIPGLTKPILPIKPFDILWVKVIGSSDELSTMTKIRVSEILSGVKQDFRLDLIPTDTKSIGKVDNNVPQVQILDTIINNLQNTDNTRKSKLKDLWKQFT